MQKGKVRLRPLVILGLLAVLLISNWTLPCAAEAAGGSVSYAAAADEQAAAPGSAVRHSGNAGGFSSSVREEEKQASAGGSTADAGAAVPGNTSPGSQEGPSDSQGGNDARSESAGKSGPGSKSSPVLNSQSAAAGSFENTDDLTGPDTSSAQGDAVDWFSGFEEISEDELKAVLESGSTDVSSAAMTQDSETLYLVTEDGRKYSVAEPTANLRSYIQLLGVQISSVSIASEPSETVAGRQKAANVMSCVMLFFLLGIPVVLLLVSRYCQKRSSEAAVKPVNAKQNSASDDVPCVKFSDVEGIEDLKADMLRLVDCLEHPAKYAAIGARPPKGVILYGPPGTGKTLIARAIAGEAGVPFFSAAGSDFVEKYVGVGASRVRELYKKARKAAPCIVFIDEIDAVASHRGRDDNSEKDQTVNALLTELDGFSSSDSIITICATNRLDMLDSAFSRAGRFDLQLAVGLPDYRSRVNILRIHSRGKKLSSEVDLESTARKTQGFSGAELEALMNEAALTAVGRESDMIEPCDLDEAFFKIVMKGNKKRSEPNPAVAWHESGHTLATKLLTNDSVPSVTIVGSASGAGGATFRAAKEDAGLQSRADLEHLVEIMYAGRAAEELYFGSSADITTGAAQDIKSATSVIREYLASYGMGSRGLLDLSQFSQEYSEIVDEASEMAHRLYSDVLSLLQANRQKLQDLADALLHLETLDEEEIDAVIAGKKDQVIADSERRQQELAETVPAEAGGKRRSAGRTAAGAGLNSASWKARRSAADANGGGDDSDPDDSGDSGDGGGDGGKPQRTAQPAGLSKKRTGVRTNIPDVRLPGRKKAAVWRREGTPAPEPVPAHC